MKINKYADREELLTMNGMECYLADSQYSVVRKGNLHIEDNPNLYFGPRFIYLDHKGERKCIGITALSVLFTTEVEALRQIETWMNFEISTAEKQLEMLKNKRDKVREKIETLT